MTYLQPRSGISIALIYLSQFQDLGYHISLFCKIKPNSKTILVRPSLGRESDLWTSNIVAIAQLHLCPRPTHSSEPGATASTQKQVTRLKTAFVWNTSVPSPSPLYLFFPLLRNTSAALFLLPLWHVIKVVTPVFSSSKLWSSGDGRNRHETGKNGLHNSPCYSRSFYLYRVLVMIG